LSRLRIPTRDAAPHASRKVLDAVYAKLGVVPNVFRLIGSSPAALGAFATLHGNLERALDPKTRERISLAVAQCNGSDYCLSAHSYAAMNSAKLGPDEIALNREGRSKDAKAEAAVRFAVAVVEQRGRVADADVERVRAAGYDDAQIVEIVALIAENIFTNYLNEVARTEIDFPPVRSRND